MEPAQRCLIQRRDQIPGLDVSHRITPPLMPSSARLRPGAFLAAETIDRRQRPADLEMHTK
jgi:hypothetical protein